MEARRRLHIKAKTLPIGEGFVITNLIRATTWGRPYGGRMDHPQITNICLASRTSLGMAPTKRTALAFCGKEEAPAPKAKVFRRKTEQLRRAPTTRHSVEGFSTQYIRALGQASRLRIDAGDHIGSPLRMSVSKYGFTGRGRTPPLRNPRLSEKGFSTRIIRALGQASRLRIG